MLSSTSVDELRRTAGRLADWVSEHADGAAAELSDLSYTLARRRAHRPVRTAVLASSHHELVTALRDVADGDAPCQTSVAQENRGAVWVFSGQGSQWAGMGAGLLASEPVFAATVAELEPLIIRESGFSVTQALSAPEAVTGIERIQPSVFTMQVGLAAALKAYGAVPGAVIGHSLGEVAAAVVAGALSMEDGVKVICRRSKLMSRIAGSGAMASVELPAAKVLSELAARDMNDVVLSVVASPQSTVVGGATGSIHDLVAAWEASGLMAREVAVDVASHSPQVDPILDDLAEALADITPMKPTVPYYSATLYDPHDEPFCDAHYWVANLRQMVRFAAAAQAAMEDGYRVFGELAPHPLLTQAVEQIGRGLDIPLAALPSMRREQDLPHGLRGVVADIHCAGAAVDFAVLCPDARLVDAPLPTWTHPRLLLSRDGHEQAQVGSTVAVHPLLGAHVRLPEQPERHVWQADVGTAAQPWLGDHQVHDVDALPAAAYCEMALAAARVVLGEAAEVRDMSFEQILLLEDETPVSAVVSATSPAPWTSLWKHTKTMSSFGGLPLSFMRATMSSYPATTWPICLGHIRGSSTARSCGTGSMHGASNMAPPSQVLSQPTLRKEPVPPSLAEVALPGSIRSQQGAYGIHPALLDACFQAVAAHPDLYDDVTGTLLLPLGVRRLRRYGSTRNAHYCYARLTRATATQVEADLDVLDDHGAVLLTVQGLRLGTGVSESGQRERLLTERLLTIEWKQHELPDRGPARSRTVDAHQHLRCRGSAGYETGRRVETA